MGGDRPATTSQSQRDPEARPSAKFERKVPPRRQVTTDFGRPPRVRGRIGFGPALLAVRARQTLIEDEAGCWPICVDQPADAGIMPDAASVSLKIFGAGDIPAGPPLYSGTVRIT
eukprot:evm.model.scf_1264.3 EVM.evm.TU.scf_1264.3   scf_1264:39855-40199(+)